MKAWEAADYLALCQAIDSDMGGTKRILIREGSEVQQQTLDDKVVASVEAQVPESAKDRIV
jgi:hypothetical protein